MTIGYVALAISLVALGFAIRAWRTARAKSKRLAAAYAAAVAAEPVRRGQLVARDGDGRVRPISPSPIRPRSREPETDELDWPRPAPTPTFEPDLFNIPSPLDPSPAPSDWSAPSPIEPGGGEFGGAGASGSWDPPKGD